MSWKEPKVSHVPQAQFTHQDVPTHSQDIKPEIKDLLYFANHATALRNSTSNLVTVVSPDDGSTYTTPSSSTLPPASVIKVEPSSNLIPLPSSSCRISSVLTDDCAIMPPPPPPPPKPPTSPGVISSTSDQEGHSPTIGREIVFKASWLSGLVAFLKRIVVTWSAFVAHRPTDPQRRRGVHVVAATGLDHCDQIFKVMESEIH